MKSEKNDVPGIHLRDEQDDLIHDLVEAERRAETRQEFVVIQLDQADSLVSHAGLPSSFHAYDGDLIALMNYDLITYRLSAKSIPPGGAFDITQRGLGYYKDRFRTVE